MNNKSKYEEEDQQQELKNQSPETEEKQPDLFWSSLSWKRQVACPYNENHKVSEMRLIFHLAKCPDAKSKAHLFRHCYFNTSHRIKNEQYIDHLKECKDKPEDFDLNKLLNPDENNDDDWTQDEDYSNIDINNPWLPQDIKDKAIEYQKKKDIMEKMDNLIIDENTNPIQEKQDKITQQK